ncbi:MAG: hypothetical protein ACO3JG_11730, partial [Luteolibacter sp.]
AIRPQVENDSSVTSKALCVLVTFDESWTAHSARLAKLPSRRDLNAVRADFLATFTTALEPLGALDHFKLAGVIAT